MDDWYDHGIQNTHRYFSWYAHLKEGSLLVSVNTTILRGQRIATMGNSGTAFGVHLHFAVTKNGTGLFSHAINPCELLPCSTVDKSAPQVEFVYPTTTSPTKGDITMVASASDDVAVTRVQFRALYYGNWQDVCEGVKQGQQVLVDIYIFINI